MRPWILAKILDLEVFVSRLFDDLLIVHTGSWPDGIHTASLVVAVPAAARFNPYSVLDPFLHVVVEGITLFTSVLGLVAYGQRCSQYLVLEPSCGCFRSASS